MLTLAGSVSNIHDETHTCGACHKVSTDSLRCTTNTTALCVCTCDFVFSSVRWCPHQVWPSQQDAHTSSDPRSKMPTPSLTLSAAKSQQERAREVAMNFPFPPRSVRESNIIFWLHDDGKYEGSVRGNMTLEYLVTWGMFDENKRRCRHYQRCSSGYKSVR